MNARSFRLMDLLVCVAVCIALLTVGLSVRHSAQEDSVIVECAGRLSQLAQGLVMYQGLYDGQFPRTRYDPAAPVTAFTQPDAADPFAPTGPAANDVTASLFLLARTLDYGPQAFTCPAATRHNIAQEDTFDRKTAKQRSNFRARLNDNFSLANMYPDAAATAAGYSLDHFRTRLPANFAIAADTNPGGEGVTGATTQMSRMNMRMANSPNHERDGQNVMFADGSVSFFNSPFVGINFDNIYTGQAGAKTPKTAADSVLLPIWSDGPQVTSAAIINRRWVLGGSMVIVFAILGLIVRRGLKKQY